MVDRRGFFMRCAAAAAVTNSSLETRIRKVEHVHGHVAIRPRWYRMERIDPATDLTVGAALVYGVEVTSTPAERGCMKVIQLVMITEDWPESTLERPLRTEWWLTDERRDDPRDSRPPADLEHAHG